MTNCGSRGVGVEFSGKQLGKLADSHPHKRKACHTFTLELPGEQAHTLADLCQQHVKATDGKDVVFEQRQDTCTYVDTMWHFCNASFSHGLSYVQVCADP